MNTGQLNKRAPSLSWGILAFGLAGVCARLLFWWFSIGSNDAPTWYAHGMHVAGGGLADTYRRFRLFNHPPLMGLYAAQAWRWAGGDLWTFARLMKLPGLLGEALTMGVLWRVAGARTFAIYACLPAAILVTGYHANTDGLCAALVVVAVIAFDRERYFLSGLLWSAALNVKLLPLPLVPLAFLGVPNRKAFLRLSAGFGLGLAPFLPPALAAGSAMFRNMILYNSYLENWGIMALLNLGLANHAIGEFVRPIYKWWSAAGRYAILLSVMAVALISRFRRKMPMTEQAALGAALFLILAPGFGVQYVIYAAPLLCLVDLQEGIVWGWTSGIFIASVYWVFRSSWMPLQSDFEGAFPFPANAIGILPWAVLLHFVWRHIRSGLTPLGRQAGAAVTTG